MRSSNRCKRRVSYAQLCRFLFRLFTKRVFSFASSRGRRVGDAAGEKGAVAGLVLAVEAQGRKGPPQVLGWFLLNPKMPPFASHKTLFAFLWVATLASLFIWQRNTISGFLVLGGVPVQPPPKLRPVVFCLTEFGGVGDNVTLNTEAFEKGVRAISKLGNKGSGQLIVPLGRWLTTPFNLTSHMTLFLPLNAVILAIQFVTFVDLIIDA
ncbi:polygalacturonase protein [Vigna angularis]|uniref:Polygalacturonase protein n=1 Tax=Phaseolus angularis TaxID=3914 RepID=A0A8T0KKC8_PHAAN|nr:polygalacturonase protein [Vigna angularis]